MTRPEWLWAAVPLFAVMLVSTHGTGRARRLAVHALAAVACLYAVVGIYVAAYARYEHGPFVVIPRIVALGKVMQYRMQDDAPARYADVSRQIDTYLAAGDRGPYEFLARHPELEANLFRGAGDYARATIVNDPIEYLWHTVETAHTTTKYRWPFGSIDDDGRFAAGCTSSPTPRRTSTTRSRCSLSWRSGRS